MIRREYIAQRLTEISLRLRKEDSLESFSSRSVDDLEICLEALQRVLDGRPVRFNRWSWRDTEESHLRLVNIEAKLDLLMSSARPCQLSRDISEHFPQFLTSVSQGDMEVGANRFREHFAKWFDKQRRCIIVDPYIFNSGEEKHRDYIDGLDSIIGDGVQRIDFYFRRDRSCYEEVLANDIFKKLQRPKRQIRFYACPKLHDRVWLRHHSIADDAGFKDWQARAIGTSLNGIQKLPTYVLDMDGEDANEYAKYLTNLRFTANASDTPPTTYTPIA